jgi:hypothetical protein
MERLNLESDMAAASSLLSQFYRQSDGGGSLASCSGLPWLGRRRPQVEQPCRIGRVSLRLTKGGGGGGKVTLIAAGLSNGAYGAVGLFGSYGIFGGVGFGGWEALADA